MSGLLERIARRRGASASSRPVLQALDALLARLNAGGDLPAPAGRLGSGEEPADAQARLDGVHGEAIDGVNGHVRNAVNGHVVNGVNGHTPNGVNGQALDGVSGVNGHTPDGVNGQVANGVNAHALLSGHEVVAEPGPPPAPPAPAERSAADVPPTSAPGLLQRSRMRRRARYLRALRELQMRDLGGFLLELHRYGRERPDLVESKLAGAALVDSELRAIERALSVEHDVGQIRAPGIGGACLRCGSVHGSSDRFCAACGQLLDELEPGVPAGPAADAADASAG